MGTRYTAMKDNETIDREIKDINQSSIQVFFTNIHTDEIVNVDVRHFVGRCYLDGRYLLNELSLAIKLKTSTWVRDARVAYFL